MLIYTFQIVKIISSFRKTQYIFMRLMQVYRTRVHIQIWLKHFIFQNILSYVGIKITDLLFQKHKFLHLFILSKLNYFRRYIINCVQSNIKCYTIILCVNPNASFFVTRLRKLQESNISLCVILPKIFTDTLSY